MSSPFDRILAAARAAASVDVDIRWKTPELPTAPKAGLVTRYQPPGMQKLTIVDLDQGKGGGIVAQYNPKEIQVDKSASWAQSTTNSGNSPEMQFTATNARALTLELFFDTYETVGPGGKPYDVHEEYIKKLQLLTYVMNPEGDEWERRPPRVMVLWGEDLPRFVGVVESVSTKYTMFMPGGRPVRATVSLKLTEALRTSNAPPGSTPPNK